MKITSVSYKKIFPIAQFVNETIGIEATVDEGEDPSDVLDKLKEKITMWHLASEIAEDAKNKWATNPPPPTIDPPHSEGETIQVGGDPILRGINEAQSLEELAKYKQAAGNNGFLILYMNRVKELNAKIS